jgi:hypothetical protein
MASIIIEAKFKNGATGLVRIDVAHLVWVKYGLNMQNIDNDELPESIHGVKLYSSKGTAELDTVPGTVSSVRLVRSCQP